MDAAVNVHQRDVTTDEIQIQVENVEVHAIENVEVLKVKCDDCQFDTQFRETMESHRQAKHIQLEAQPYSCKECDYQNVEEKNLRKHTEESHGNEEEYEYNSCDFRSNNKDVIPNHIKEMHSAKKPL